MPWYHWIATFLNDALPQFEAIPLLRFHGRRVGLWPVVQRIS